MESFGYKDIKIKSLRYVRSNYNRRNDNFLNYSN